MPAPIVVLGTAALAGAATVGGAAATSAAIHHGPAVAHRVTEAVRRRFGAGAHSPSPSDPTTHGTLVGRLALDPDARERLIQTVERCPQTPVVASSCPCRQRRQFHTEAVEFLRAPQMERLSWTSRPGSDEAEHLAIAGRLRSNDRDMWQQLARSFYASGDLPSLAVREGLQNGIDAIMRAVKEGKLAAGQGRFEVTYAPRNGEPFSRTNTDGVLTMTDNGVGMEFRTKTTRDGVELDPDCTLAKFLTLAATGKTDDPEAAGGFGVAKAVILGASNTGAWTIHTRNVLVTSRAMLSPEDQEKLDPAADFWIDAEAPFYQGTKIVLYGVPNLDGFSTLVRASTTVNTRLSYTLRYCTTPDVMLVYNNELVRPFFPETGGRVIEAVGSWGDKVQGKIRRFDRSNNTRGGFWVRVASAKRNYLLQWGTASGRNSMTWDIVVDLKIGLRPKDPAYPIKSSRDGFVDSTTAYHTMDRLIRGQEEQAESAETIDWKVIEPDENAEDRQELKTLLAAPDVKNALGAVSEVLAAHHAAAREAHTRLSQPAGFESDEELPGDMAGEGGYSREGEDLGEDQGGWSSGRERTPEPPPKGTPIMDKVQALALEISGGNFDNLPYRIRSAIELLIVNERDGSRSYGSHVENLVEWFGENADALGASRTGDLNGALAGLITLAPSYEAEELEAKVQKAANPLGKALIKISMTQYDHPKVDEDGRVQIGRDGKPKYDTSASRKFMRRYKRYVPALILWDFTVRLVHAAADVAYPVRTGFVLDRTARGLCTREHGHVYVLVNPESFDAFVQNNKARPLSIAAFLHGVASHELAHAGLIGSGHNEDWAVQREDIGFKTTELLPVIEAAVLKVLRLRDPNKQRGRLTKLQARLAQAEAAAKDYDRMVALARAAEDQAATLSLAQSDLWEARQEVRQLKAEKHDMTLTRGREVLNLLQSVDMAMRLHEFREYLDSPLGMVAVEHIEVPGYGRGAPALRRVLQEDPHKVYAALSKKVRESEMAGA